MSEPTQQGMLVKAIDQMPWWVQAMLLVGSTFGMPVVILGFYMAQDAGLVGNPVADRLEEVKGAMIQHQAVMQDLTHAVERQGEQLVTEARGRQMRCVIRATTPEQKRACFPAIEDQP